MSDVLGAAALVLGILVFIALVFALAMVPVRRRAKRVQADLEEDMGGPGKRTGNVLGLGLESRGRAQVRGNGRLALTHDELRFAQWVPRRETTIALADVTSVGTEKTWLGKWVGAKLLCVRWRTADGGEDAMAWQVQDLEGWLAALHAPRGGTTD